MLYRSYYPIGFLKGNLRVNKGSARHVWLTFHLTGRGELALVNWGGNGPIGVDEVKRFRDNAGGDIVELIERTRNDKASYSICGKYYDGNRLSWKHFLETNEIEGTNAVQGNQEISDEELNVNKSDHIKMLHIDCKLWMAEWWEDGGVIGETPIPPPPIQLLYCTPTGTGSVIISVGKKDPATIPFDKLILNYVKVD